MTFTRIDSSPEKQPDGQPQPNRVVALGYDPEKDSAPRVLATGRGAIADQIIAVAKANGIPIREDPVLAAALSTLELDQMIPPELYAVVAEVLVYVYRIREKHTEW